jgi:putative acyl-CoA dehydrogenase
VARAAKVLAWGTADAGHLCPISMTYAVVPALRTTPELAAQYEPLLTNREYDYELRAPLSKRGLIAGMSMTEKQGGSDVRANTTRAVPRPDGTFRLTGHKWFTSAPMSDLFLTLAQAPGGLSCFLVPRILPDGTRNNFFLQRLKDKLGNKSNASSEVEFRGAYGTLVGEEGHGIREAISMGHLTRLECALSSAGIMRHAVAQAAHHVSHRRAFQKSLIDQPMMANVVADLHLESTAAAWLAFRVLAASGREDDASERLLSRIGAPIAKYWICKRAVPTVAEALECHGGNGFIEDHLMARLYREAPLNGIWEGSGNVMCLDVLRSMAREPACVPALLDEIRLASGQNRRFDAAIAALADDLADLARHEGQARRLVERLATVWSASLLVRYAEPAIADAFIASRLGDAWTGAFGTLPPSIDPAPLARMAAPLAA